MASSQCGRCDVFHWTFTNISRLFSCSHECLALHPDSQNNIWDRCESWWIRPPILSWTTQKLRLRFQKLCNKLLSVLVCMTNSLPLERFVRQQMTTPGAQVVYRCKKLPPSHLPTRLSLRLLGCCGSDCYKTTSRTGAASTSPFSSSIICWRMAANGWSPLLGNTFTTSEANINKIISSSMYENH